jgi:excisionase family DNA binding protein
MWRAYVQEPLTVDEVATFLRVKPQTLYAWVYQKRIPAQKVASTSSGRNTSLSLGPEHTNSSKPNLKPRTVALYETLFRIHIAPELGPLSSRLHVPAYRR